MSASLSRWNKNRFLGKSVISLKKSVFSLLKCFYFHFIGQICHTMGYIIQIKTHISFHVCT